ncbi:MAG: hypothetical protein ACRYGR_05395 [Janthinobacterium lividum]
MIKEIIQKNIKVIILFMTYTGFSNPENKDDIFNSTQIIIHQPLEKEAFDAKIQPLYFEDNKVEKVNIQGSPLLTSSQSNFDFLQYLPYDTSLKSLTLKNCGLTHKEANYIWEALRYNNLSLETLDLSQNPLTQQDASGSYNILGESFGPVIQKTETLRELYLNDLNLKDWRVNSISAAFTVNTTISILSLKSGKIDDLGAMQLSKMIMANRTLQQLDLSNNNITKSGLKQLMSSLKGNTKLKEINLKGNPITKNDLYSLGFPSKNSVFIF